MMRFVLAFISRFLSLAISADNRSRECNGCWSPAADAPAFEDTLGVNIHFVDPKPGELKMIADAGFRWVRMDCKWEAIEREPGRYDFSAYDRLLKQLDDFHLRPLFILDYGNPLYTAGMSVRTPESRAAFTRWAVATAQHFAGRGIVWELFNEPNMEMFWPPQPDAEEYNALAQQVTGAFHSSVPDEQLIGPATSQIDFRFIEATLNSVGSFSAISVHPYRHSNPETVADDYARLRQLVDKHRAQSDSQAHDIISSEWGYSSVWSRMTEDQQAVMLVRQFLTNVANGIRLSIWYDWHDDGDDPKEPEDHFGLVRYPSRVGAPLLYEPKPAFIAAQTLTTVLKGFRFAERLNVGSADDYVLAFSRGGERRFVVWTTSTTPHRLTIPNWNGGTSIKTMTGAAGGKISPANGALAIDVSPMPQYLLPLS